MRTFALTLSFFYLLIDSHAVFTYRYFLYRFPHLCILAVPDTGDPNEEPIGCVVGKIDEQDGEEEEGHQEECNAIIEEEEAEASLSSNVGITIGNVDATTNEYDDETKPTTTGDTGGGGRAGDDTSVSDQTTGYIGKLCMPLVS